QVISGDTCLITFPGNFQEVESCYLVPGDLLVLLGNKMQLPCDAILIDGGCIVDEGMLTGESIPVTKTPLPKEDNSMPWKIHSVEDYKRHLLFCGTEVIQTKAAGLGKVTAVVLQTGAATIGMIYTVCVYEPTEEIVKKALDVITIAVPPALPAALTTGIIYAQKRLKKNGIFCISPQRINICGQLNLVCFDKVCQTQSLSHMGLTVKLPHVLKKRKKQAPWDLFGFFPGLQN
uniref:ATPase 13A4 n=1 Tax=Ornithorhynchus anatinus TaxID=9258 RepID=A0A6I8PAZ8_ORNAN